MENMQINDIRQLTAVEINEKITTLKRDLLNLRFQQTHQQLANNQEINKKKKLIARLNTVLNESLIKTVKKEILQQSSIN